MCIINSLVRQLLSNMADHVYDWLQAKAMGWVPSPPVNKIDTHHHFVPDFYAKGLLTDHRKIFVLAANIIV